MQAAALIAHQGGWDEIILIVAPMVTVWFLLRMAKRRIHQRPPEL